VGHAASDGIFRVLRRSILEGLTEPQLRARVVELEGEVSEVRQAMVALRDDAVAAASAAAAREAHFSSVEAENAQLRAQLRALALGGGAVRMDGYSPFPRM